MSEQVVTSEHIKIPADNGLSVEQLVISDIAEVVDLARHDLQGLQVFGGNESVKIYSSPEHVASEILASNAYPLYYVVLGIKQDEKITGLLTLARRDAKVGVLAYWVAEPFRGQGQAPRAVQALSSYLFERTQVERLIALVAGGDNPNTASMRTMQKAGFSFAGDVEKDGKDFYRYELRKPTQSSVE